MGVKPEDSLTQRPGDGPSWGVRRDRNDPDHLRRTIGVKHVGAFGCVDSEQMHKLRGVQASAQRTSGCDRAIPQCGDVQRERLRLGRATTSDGQSTGRRFGDGELVVPQPVSETAPRGHSPFGSQSLEHVAGKPALEEHERDDSAEADPVETQVPEDLFVALSVSRCHYQSSYPRSE